MAAVIVLAAVGFGLPALAQSQGARPGTRLAAVPVVAAPGEIGSATVRLPFRATHIGLRWRGNEDHSVEIRWPRPGAERPWQPLPIWEDTSDPDLGLVASGLVRPEPGATRLAVRWPAGVSDLTVVAIDAGPRAAPLAASAERSVRPRPAANGSPPPPPDVITRAGWGADEGMRTGTPQFAPISKLVVHHTVTQNNDPDPAQTVRAIFAYHTRTSGWDDIGYNFLVDEQGRVYEGRHARVYRRGEAPTGEDDRRRGVIGAHAQAVNPGTVGIAVLGDYSGGVVPPGPALDGLVRLLAWKAARHNIDPNGAAPFTAKDGSRRTFPNVAGHRDVGDTACPGGRLYERLPEIRQRVAGVIRPAASPAPSPRPSPPPAPPMPAPPPPVPEFPGFWATDADGRISAFGDVRSAGDLAGQKPGSPIVSLAATPTGRGYWMVGADGAVFAFGDAPLLGAPIGQLRSPAVHLEPSRTGKGYWVLSTGGEVVPFGDAGLAGQLFPLPVNAVGLAATPTGQGYWIATADARVFAFGDAILQAATGGNLSAAGAEDASPKPNGPTVAIAASPDGKGYWLLGRDGAVFSFGVPFHGNVGERRPDAKAIDLRATDSGAGYYVAGGDGAVFAFGDADRRRERPGGGSETVVDVAFRPTGATPPPSGGPPPAPAPNP